jgi:ADP-ribosyl-[dinitrogen reductase] hydrolase
MPINRDTDPDHEILARAQGCLIGQLVGDALGSMVEFKSAEVIRALYPAGLRVIGPSTVHRTIAGQVTDDSELALALARSLAARGAFDEEDVARAYADWRESDPFDVGGTIGRATSAMGAARSRGVALAAAGQAAASRSSEANGALMRQSPLAIWGAHLDADALATFVRADTTLTHPNQVCQDASAAFIVALAATIRDGLDRPAAYERALAWDDRHGASPSVTAALKAAASTRPAYEINGGHVLHAIQNAFYQALHASSFEEGIVDTVMHGGDPDTNGAIAGALLGAIHTVAGIPEQWRTAVLECRPAHGASGVHRPRPETYWPDDAYRLVEELLAAGIPLPAGHDGEEYGPRPKR